MNKSTGVPGWVYKQCKNRNCKRTFATKKGGKRRYCEKCEYDIVTSAADQIKNRRGIIYERWAEKLKQSLKGGK